MNETMAGYAQIITCGRYNADDGLDGNYVALATAVIGKAIKDYDSVLERLYVERNPKERIALFAVKAEIESFFHSAWFSTLSDLDPHYLMRRTREIATKTIKQRIRKRHLQEVGARGGQII